MSIEVYSDLIRTDVSPVVKLPVRSRTSARPWISEFAPASESAPRATARARETETAFISGLWAMSWTVSPWTTAEPRMSTIVLPLVRPIRTPQLSLSFASASEPKLIGTEDRASA
jgi:hypothetical protein